MKSGESLTPEQLAERLQVGVNWVYEKSRSRGERSGKPLPVLRCGRYLRFYWPDVCEWLRGPKADVFYRRWVLRCREGVHHSAQRKQMNPLAAIPHKTTFHEIAHIVLGHTASEKLVDSEQTPRNVREVEAESVALICCETLGLDGADFCRAYIQHWLKTEAEIPNKSAVRIFAAATSILKAGTNAAGGH